MSRQIRDSVFILVVGLALAAPTLSDSAPSDSVASGSPPSNSDPANSGPAVMDPVYRSMCEAVLSDRPELMKQCVDAQGEAHSYVMTWFEWNGLMTPDGEVDSLQLLEAQSDPLRAMVDTPASTAAFCVDATQSWIGMADCITALDQNAFGAGMGMGPGIIGGDPGMMGSTPGDFGTIPGAH